VNWNEYREACKKYANHDKGDINTYLILGYFSEIGEILGVFKKHIRGDYGIPEMLNKLKGEIGDCFWYLAMIENVFESEIIDIKELGINLVAKGFIPDALDIDYEYVNLENLSNDYGLSVMDVWQYNIDKLEDRFNRGVIKGSGDER